MNRIIRFAFYAIGTFLLLFSSIIVGVNFYKDSGVFDKEVVEVKKQSVQPAKSTTPKKIVVESQPTGKAPAKETTAAVSTNNNKQLVVEVINCTEKRGLAEEVREMLEAQGLKVSAGTDSETQGTSQIIIRKKGSNIDILRNTLKISVVKEELQSDSRFDVTILLGSDFNP